MAENLLPANEIIEIYSRVDLQVLLAVLYVPSALESRVDLTNRSSLLQVAVVPLSDGFKVSPHKHNPTPRETVGTNEAWVVVSGSIRVDIFDLDEILLGSWILNQGAIAVAANGGHGLTSLQSGTLVYEFKNGPYWGPDVDKVQIKN